MERSHPSDGSAATSPQVEAYQPFLQLLTIYIIYDISSNDINLISNKPTKHF